MMRRSLSGLLSRSAGRSSAEDELLSQIQFRAALRRERLRADRTSNGFTLLTLSLARRQVNAETLSRVAEVLKCRVRESDIAGWFADGVLGVILPDTPSVGAWKLADDLASVLEEHRVKAEYTVYAYPTLDSDVVDSSAESEVAGEGAGLADRPVRPLEMLFIQKISLWKRAIDMVCAGAGLLAASVVMIPAALAIKLTSPGPIFYAQQRDGLGGRKFWIYKFRTMIVNADAIKAQLRALSEQDGPAFKLKNDPRVTPIGRFLRRTCIDELPQLWNVLRGDMSLVGPRPMCSKEARQCAPWERRRLDVTPGLTCIWQVYGGTKVTFTEWMRMDLRYIGSHSLWDDLRLIVLTVPSVIRRDGVY